MTKEELKQEAEAEADKVVIGSGMDRTSVIHLKHLLVTMYIQGATKATKELEAQIEKMQETLKSDLIARLKEDISYSTSPSCTKGMELFIESIEEWEIKEK